MSKQITRDDILPMERYAAIRRDKAREITAIKRHRRMAIGPEAMIYFENYDTMWRQIHEMLFVERGGEEQVDDEARRLQPVDPKGAGAGRHADVRDPGPGKAPAHPRPARRRRGDGGDQARRRAHPRRGRTGR
ncbi:MAG: DUF3501 family protein [Arhodomonas sp.]|nr:DUF3501 family protein [Arhodomonas sp.]